MAYTMCPDEGYPRLYRYIEHGPLATLDTDNLLLINRLKFDKLSPNQRHRVLRTPRSLADDI